MKIQYNVAGVESSTERN